MTPLLLALPCAALTLLLPLLPVDASAAPAAPASLARAATPAPAAAREDGTETAQARADRRGRAALEALRYPWRDLGDDVVFRPYRGRVLGTTDSRARRITVFVGDEHSDLTVRATTAHELGHALDVGHGTVERHRRYREVRALAQSGAWYPCDGCRDDESDAGDWAEVFAVSLVGDGDFRSRRAGRPTRQQLERLTPLFRVPAPAAAPTPSAAPSSSPTPEPAPLLPLLT